MTNVQPAGRLAAVLLIGMTASAEADVEPPGQPAAFSAAAVDDGMPGQWVHQSIPGVDRENQFRLEADGSKVVMRVDSERSASMLGHTLVVNPDERPVLSWRWKVANIVEGSDFTRKAGDDYAARVYVLFDYPLDRLSFGDRMRLRLARAVYGEDLPAAAITYVWGNAQEAGDFGPNPYTDRVRMKVLDSGPERVGQWVAHDRNVADDFERLFGEPAPSVIGIAIGADTDDTEESVTAWFGDLSFTAAD